MARTLRGSMVSTRLPYSIGRVALFLLLLACAMLQLRFAVQEQEVLIGKANVYDAVKSRNPYLLTNVAKEKYLFEADLNGATTLLQKALVTNPYYVPAWLGLAEVNNDKGQKELSYKILDYVHFLTNDIKRWRWEKTLVAYQLGATKFLSTELNYIIGEVGGKPRRDALQLGFTLWADSQRLLENVGIENISHLFYHAIITNYPEHALNFWKEIDTQSLGYNRKHLLRCIDMLMRNDHILAAGELWRKHINSERLFYDGNFQQPFMHQAFGWRKNKNKSVVTRVEPLTGKSDQKLLHFRFKGWDNIKYHHLYQIVPLNPGEIYRLSADIKSDRLTTDQLPFIETYGYKCKSQPYKKGEMVAPNQDWTNYTFEFGVSQNCAAAVVHIRRLESRQIDNKISGHLWIKNLRIESTGDKFMVLDPHSI